MLSNRQRKDSEQQQARAAQRRLEDAAPRLRDLIPSLRSMRLHVQERRSDGNDAALPYTRHIVVETGPALFSIRCVEARCNGRHEITAELLKGLHAAQTRIEGESTCQGEVGDLPCDRTLCYVCDAEYKH